MGPKGEDVGNLKLSYTSKSDSQVKGTPLASTTKQIACLKRELQDVKTALADLKNKRQRKSMKFRPPPDPPRGHMNLEEYKPTPIPNTLMTILQQILTVMVIRMNSYVDACQACKDLQDTKVPINTTNLITELLYYWYRALMTQSRDSCFASFLVQSTDDDTVSLLRRPLSLKAFKTLKKYLTALGQPQYSGGNQIADSPSLSMTIPKISRTATSNTPTVGSTHRFDPGPSTNLNFGASHNNIPAIYRFCEENILENSQNTCVARGDDFYTLKSKIVDGSHAVVLQIYDVENIKNIPRKDWWTVADFRGTVITGSRRILETSLQLREMMEDNLAKRPDVSCTRFRK